MSVSNESLPQLGDRPFLSDGGIETYFMFHRGADLPHGAAYLLLGTEAGTAELRDYFDHYLAIAADFGTGFVFESATWRANPDWAARVGTSPEELDALNRRSIELLRELRERWAPRVPETVLSGCVGPRSDAYRPSEIMSERDAEDYHATQVRSLAAAGAEVISGITITNVPEAIGITRAAHAVDLPAVISFTVETDGTLRTGDPLAEAIARVDAMTGVGPAYYMVNCAHPTHIAPALDGGGEAARRVRGLRVNASSKSHAELDESPTLDEGDPPQLGADFRAIRDRHPHVNVLGGCCGTDHRHILAIAQACLGR